MASAFKRFLKQSTEYGKIAFRNQLSHAKQPSSPPKKIAYLIPPMPLLASTIYRHYTKGPPAASWSLTFHVLIALMRDIMKRSSKGTVENLQRLTRNYVTPLPFSISRSETTLPNDYRERAGDILKNLLTEDDNRRIGWDWSTDRTRVSELQGEWLTFSQSFFDTDTSFDASRQPTILYLHGGAYYIGCYSLARQWLSRLIKLSNARCFSVNYRLAPQHPFPAALEDALAAYLYLVDPPASAKHAPVDPKNIIITGESAGGGLTVSLLLAIRDSGLIPPRAAMPLSPWVDLTHSLPSITSNIATDYLPPVGFKHIDSPALNYSLLPPLKDEHAKDKSKPEQACNKETEHDPTKDRSDGLERVQFYAGNDALKLPLVSPIFDKKNLHGLPPMLIQVGKAERLRDESICAALKATNMYPGAPSSSDIPTKIDLELYVDQPHVFQILLPTKIAVKAIEHLAAYVRDVFQKSPTELQQSPRLTIHEIAATGKSRDTTEKLMRKMTSDTWKDWIGRLDHPNLKDRMRRVETAYERILEQLKKENEP
ncbi:Alpha/Beta hydrolase protein [Radiomyces spectabilis]|uniref:Alpha/Beta hydrolase protein n=1 Tax=Radiomyces spectabilis TaxID=64574 RepID=UPI00221EC505|nr:Alpha/Beta hydrolase protein [Radiomyces spectabilis]KAI8393859.1 Alpha/Beta hydrolase protein [Radiomyces spectabilis]